MDQLLIWPVWVPWQCGSSVTPGHAGNTELQRRAAHTASCLKSAAVPCSINKHAIPPMSRQIDTQETLFQANELLMPTWNSNTFYFLQRGLLSTHSLLLIFKKKKKAKRERTDWVGWTLHTHCCLPPTPTHPQLGLDPHSPRMLSRVRIEWGHKNVSMGSAWLSTRRRNC